MCFSPELSYLDLVNGPQDHGWCMGYTCQKRLSLFPILLANGELLLESPVFLFVISETSANSALLRHHDFVPVC